MCVPRDTSVLPDIIIVYLVLLVGGKLPNSLKRQILATCEKYHISYFFPFLASDDTRFITLLPRFEVCLPRVCTLFSCL